MDFGGTFFTKFQTCGTSPCWAPSLWFQVMFSWDTHLCLSPQQRIIPLFKSLNVQTFFCQGSEPLPQIPPRWGWLPRWQPAPPLHPQPRPAVSKVLCLWVSPLCAQLQMPTESDLFAAKLLWQASRVTGLVLLLLEPGEFQSAHSGGLGSGIFFPKPSRWALTNDDVWPQTQPLPHDWVKH